MNNNSNAPATPNYCDRFIAREDVVRTTEDVPALEPIDSSMMYGMLYVGSRQVLYVHYKKGRKVYRYAKVTRAEYEGIKSGSLDPKGEHSVGRALNATMVDADAHPCTEIAKDYDPSNYNG